ncbi:MAG TPA: peptidase S10, partial [Phenylobacterium sp.]
MARARQSGLVAAGLALLVLANPAMAQVQVPTAPRVAVTHHEGAFNGQPVRYTATVAETFLKDAAGQPAAAAITIAYVRDGVADPAKRPVMFLFNGGPGASSSPLHMSALGPVIRAPAAPGDRTGGGYQPNPASPLDAVDLVFIDPVGTGFSRPFPGADPKGFYSVTGD